MINPINQNNNSLNQINEITMFAETNFRNRKVKFGIKTDDRRRHMYLIGKTGTGKSVTMENMIVSDIQKGNGLAVVDPHGDTVEKVVKHIPNNRVNDVIYFNPADTEYPIAFNILEKVDPSYKNLVASGLVGVFKKIWADSWGPRLEYILMNTILALMEYPGSTLLGITRMLVDKNYRKKVIEKLTDPIVKAFWVDEYANYNERFRTEAISPIQNKVGQFLSSSVIRNIVGQPKSTIDLRKIMDEKKILLLNLAKGRIGEENSALLGAMMITKLQLSAMSRVDIPEEDRKDFYLYVDEFQNFSTESFANILSEARKYRLNLIIAHQYIEQLSDVVRAAVFGNVGTLVVFRVGAEDGEFLEKEFEPSFTQNDLVNLPKYNIYLKLMIDGVSSSPFSASTFPPVSGETGNLNKIINSSRERYSKPIKEVEDKILRWSGVEDVYKATAHEDNEDDDTRPKQNRPIVNNAPVRNFNNEKKAEAISHPAPNSVVRILGPDSARKPQNNFGAGYKPQTIQPDNKPRTQNNFENKQVEPPKGISLKDALSKEPVQFRDQSRSNVYQQRNGGVSENNYKKEQIITKNNNRFDQSAKKSGNTPNNVLRPGQTVRFKK